MSNCCNILLIIPNSEHQLTEKTDLPNLQTSVHCIPTSTSMAVGQSKIPTISRIPSTEVSAVSLLMLVF